MHSKANGNTPYEFTQNRKPTMEEDMQLRYVLKANLAASFSQGGVPVIQSNLGSSAPVILSANAEHGGASSDEH